MIYNFDNLGDLAAHCEQIARDKRAHAALTTLRASDRHDVLTEATCFEYLSQVIRKSNLIQGRFIEVDSDLAQARTEVEKTVVSLRAAAASLSGSADQLSANLQIMPMPQIVPEIG